MESTAVAQYHRDEAARKALEDALAASANSVSARMNCIPMSSTNKDS